MLHDRFRVALRALACAALAVAYIPADATGWVKLLSRTAAEQFQEDDLKMFLEAGRDALNAEGPAGLTSPG